MRWTTTFLALTAVVLCPEGLFGQAAWKQHDMSRPRPSVIEPATESLPIPAPADAIVLFNGSDLSQWWGIDGGPAQWDVVDGAMIVVAGAGPIQTERTFGDIQLHEEWSTPPQVEGTDQNRGNSGVYLMGLYEVQVLDSYQNDTYADGQAGAIYGQHPPLANPVRPSGEWQSFDIVFRHPRFDQAGVLVEPARVTVFRNGIVVQNNAELSGPTMCEPPRDCRRLQPLRGWGHEKGKEVLPRDAGESSSAGPGTRA